MAALKRFLNQKGVITLVASLILMAVVVLGIGMLTNTYMSNTVASNYKKKLQSYYAADERVTLLSQRVIDGHGTDYVDLSIKNKDIGSPGLAGSYSHSGQMYTVRGSGSDIWGSSDMFHFASFETNDDFDIMAQIYSMGGSGTTDPWSKAGIMARDDTVSAGAKHAYSCATFSNGIAFQRRKIEGGSSYNNNTSAIAPVTHWLRLQRTGNVYRGFHSSDGIAWDQVGVDTIVMTGSVFVGFAVTAHNNAALITATFTYLTGMPVGKGVDTLTYNSFMVISNLIQYSDGKYTVNAQAFLPGPANAQTFPTLLKQSISPGRTQGYQEFNENIAMVPVTFYDYRADGSNPEFQRDGATGMFLKNLVQPTLQLPERKPVRTTAFDPGWRDCVRWCHTNPVVNNGQTNCYSEIWCCVGALPEWGDDLPGTPSGWSWTRSCAMKFPTAGQQSWFFNDSLHRWFRPTNPAGCTFDTLTGRWSNLTNYSIGGWRANEYVNNSWDPANPFANIIIYDNLPFEKDLTADPTGKTFVYGKTVDPAHFVECTNPPIWSSPFGYDTESVNWRDYFHPLKNKGFKYDGPFKAARGYPDLATLQANFPCYAQQNFAFTMEFHRKFVYHSGQKFIFTGNDDVWVFINNKLAMDLGGVHLPWTDSIILANIAPSFGLVENNEYWFDFFFCERNGWDSSIFISTNLQIFVPPATAQRQWRRDYGNLD